MDEFTKQAKTRYEELEKKIVANKEELAKLEAQQKPLKAYLMEAGVMEKPAQAKRGRKPRQENPNPSQE